MFLPSAIVAFVTRKTLVRQCAACGNRQVFPPSRIRESVSCPRCGAFIPPKEQPRESIGSTSQEIRFDPD